MNNKPAPANPAASQGAGQQPKQQNYSQADLNNIVLEYLKKKGYNKSEMMLRHELSGAQGQFEQPFPINASNSGIPPTQPMMMHQRSYQAPGTSRFRMVRDQSHNSAILSEIEGQSKNPDLYFRGYKMLRKWIDSSLEMYKPQLLKLLYPVFVNCFIDLIYYQQDNKGKDNQNLASTFFTQFKDDHIMRHGKEIVEMSAISMADQLQLSGLSAKFRDTKYRVKISGVCVYLVLFFLNENTHVGGDLVIRLINQYIDLDIVTDESRGNLDPDEGVPEFQESNVEAFNSKEVKLGKFPRDDNYDKEIENELKTKDEKDSKKKPGRPTLVEEFHKIKAENANPTAISAPDKDNDDDENEDVEMEKEDGEDIGEGTIYDKMKKNDPNFQSPAKDALPLPPKTIFDLKKEVQMVQDYRARLRLSFDKNQFSPPSVCMYTFHNSLNDITCLEFNEHSNMVAAGFEDSYIKIWSIDGNPLKSVVKSDPQNNQNTRRLIGHSGTVYSLSFSPDNNYLLSSSEDGTIRLWSLDTFTTLVIYKSHNEPVWDVKFSPFGHYFLTGSHDTTARLWSVDHIYPLRLFVGHMSDVDCVAWFPNSCYCFTGSSDKTIRMWDVVEGDCVRLFLGHQGPINCLSVDPRGRLLASAGEDAVINLWDISSGKLLKSMKGHAPKGSIYSLDFSKDGNVLVSGGSDNSVRIWDVKKNSDNSLSEPEPFFNRVEETSSTGEVNKTVVSNSTGAPSSAVKADGRKKGKEAGSCTNDHVGSYFTKQTSVYKVHFTRRNLCLSAGVFIE